MSTQKRTWVQAKSNASMAFWIFNNAQLEKLEKLKLDYISRFFNSIVYYAHFHTTNIKQII